MTTELTVNLGDATPRRLLVAWANSQDAWVRKLTAETILSRQTPGEEFLDVVYETFLLEKGLTEGDSPDIPKLEVSAVDASEEEVLESTKRDSRHSLNANGDSASRPNATHTATTPDATGQHAAYEHRQHIMSA